MKNLMNCEETVSAEERESVKVVGIVEACRKLKSKAKGKTYYRISLVDETGKLNCMFFEPKLDKFLAENDPPKKESIVIITGTKADGNSVFVNEINVLNDRIYMKLSELK